MSSIPRVPEHLVQILMAVAPEPRRPNGGMLRPGDWRKHVEQIAQTVWIQGWLEGYGYRMSIEPAKMIVTTEELERIKAQFSSHTIEGSE